MAQCLYKAFDSAPVPGWEEESFVTIMGIGQSLGSEQIWDFHHTVTKAAL